MARSGLLKLNGGGLEANGDGNLLNNAMRGTWYGQQRDAGSQTAFRDAQGPAGDSAAASQGERTRDASGGGGNDPDMLARRRRKEEVGGAVKKVKRQKSPARSGGSSSTSDLIQVQPRPKARLTDLAGVDEVLQIIFELVALPFISPEIYTYLQVEPPRGILLHGPPGCGKTMLAHAIAGQLGIAFISISAPSIVGGMSGESEKTLREVFEQAKLHAPALLFLDEIDAITPKRESAQREMERRIVSQLLTCLDSLAGLPIMVIGATNRPDSLDPALRRAGRFDREIGMGVPGESARRKILQRLTMGMRLDASLDFGLLAKSTPGFVGADLTALTREAGLCAVKRSVGEVEVPLSLTTMILDQDATGAQKHAPASLAKPDDALNEDMRAILDHLAPASSLARFIQQYNGLLTAEQLSKMSITTEDFLQALTIVQPSSKREGFATIPDVNWADIGALHSIREELFMAVVSPIREPELFAQVGLEAPSGVLLWGPPGCGKTLLAKAVANESQANFISVKGPELLNKYVGESERAVRQVFARARASAPCVIFFDELDAIVPKRDDALSESSARVVNTLLTELDGLDSRKQVFVLGATNRPDIIDPAMIRPGRLDKLLYVELPTSDERVDILRTITMTKTPLAADVDLVRVAMDPRCENYSGADLKALVRESATNALRRTVFARRALEPSRALHGEMASNGSQPATLIELRDIEAAFGKVTPSVSRAQRRKYDALRRSFGGASLKETTGVAVEGTDEAFSGAVPSM